MSGRFHYLHFLVSLSMVLFAMQISGSRVAASDLKAIGFGGTYWDVNKTTGATSNPRATGITNPIEIAFAPDGRLFSAGANTNTGSQLFTIDPITGVATPVGPTGLPTLIEGGLTFSPGGTLYGAWQNDSPNEGLVTLNTTTGAGTFVGDMSGVDDVSGLAFSSSGTFYAVGSGTNTGQAQVYTIDPSTGAVLTTKNLSVIFDTGVQNEALLGAAIDPDTGVLYVASAGTNTLYTLDPSTGALTVVGSLGNLTDVSGLAFTPEPSAFVVMMVGASLIGVRRSRRLRA